MSICLKLDSSIQHTVSSKHPYYSIYQCFSLCQVNSVKQVKIAFRKAHRAITIHLGIKVEYYVCAWFFSMCRQLNAQKQQNLGSTQFLDDSYCMVFLDHQLLLFNIDLSSFYVKFCNLEKLGFLQPWEFVIINTVFISYPHTIIYLDVFPSAKSSASNLSKPPSRRQFCILQESYN